MSKSIFQPLEPLLEMHFDKPFDSLPSVLHKRVTEVFSIIQWDKLSPYARREAVQLSDMQDDPAMRGQSTYFWELFNQIGLVESNITEWELMQPQSITEKLAKENKLSELHDRLNKLQALEKQPAPETQAATPSPAPVVPQSASAVIHSTKARGNILTPVIEFAQKQCRDPQDTAEVWAALLVLAEKKSAPLIGATEDGLQYLKAGAAAIFKRGSLKKRLDR